MKLENRLGLAAAGLFLAGLIGMLWNYLSAEAPTITGLAALFALLSIVYLAEQVKAQKQVADVSLRLTLMNLWAQDALRELQPPITALTETNDPEAIVAKLRAHAQSRSSALHWGDFWEQLAILAKTSREAHEVVLTFRNPMEDFFEHIYAPLSVILREEGWQKQIYPNLVQFVRSLSQGRGR